MIGLRIEDLGHQVATAMSMADTQRPLDAREVDPAIVDYGVRGGTAH